MKTNQLPSLRKTRFSNPECSICYANTSKGVWRMFVRIAGVNGTHNGIFPEFSESGAIYSTKAELLADLESFAENYGFSI